MHFPFLFLIAPKRNSFWVFYYYYCGYACPFMQGYLAPVMFVLTERFAGGGAVKPLAL